VQLTVINSNLAGITVTQTATDNIEAELHSKHGPLMSGEPLWHALGFKNSAAFRQAKANGRLEIAVFSLRHRRGSFAFTKDVAEWLINLEREVKM